MKLRRPYTQRARAVATAVTRQRILDATIALAQARYRTDIRLLDVATAAEVSVPTILRLFGSHTALIREAFEQISKHISEQRDRADPGDIPGAIAGLFDHYEEIGDIVIRNLAQEDDPAVQPGVQIGRVRHRQWVEHHFAPQLAPLAPVERERRVDALVCICDVYTWKVLRRDMGRSRQEAELTMIWMVTRALERSALEDGVLADNPIMREKY